MDLPRIVTLQSKKDIVTHMKAVLATASVGYEGTLSFNATGYSVKIICYRNYGKSSMFPNPDCCVAPTKAVGEYHNVWKEIWKRAGVDETRYDTATMYLETFEELGLLMSMSKEHPFEYAAPELKNMFCFTDGTDAIFMFLKYDEALKIEEAL